LEQAGRAHARLQNAPWLVEKEWQIPGVELWFPAMVFTREG
jgi:hypothetical protein